MRTHRATRARAILFLRRADDLAALEVLIGLPVQRAVQAEQARVVAQLPDQPGQHYAAAGFRDALVETIVESSMQNVVMPAGLLN